MCPSVSDMNMKCPVLNAVRAKGFASVSDAPILSRSRQTPSVPKIFAIFSKTPYTRSLSPEKTGFPSFVEMSVSPVPNIID